MRTQIVSFIGCQDFRVEEDFEFYGYTITSKLDKLKELATEPSVAEKYGRIFFQEAKSGYLYQESFILPGNIDENIDFRVPLDKIHQKLTDLFLYLWFIKDHSVRIDSGFVQLIDPNKMFSREAFLYLYSSSPTTLADGSRTITTFTKTELDKAMEMYTTVENLTNRSDLEKEYRVLDEKDKYTSTYSVAPLNQIKHSTLTRIERVLLFLNLMRREAYMLTKITLGVPILECLFGAQGNNQEVGHKVAFRVSRYIEDTPEDQLKTFKFIKQIYDIRSKIVHGDRYKGDNKEYATQSINFDQLLRRVLNKVFVSDLEFFNNEKTDMDKYYEENLLF